MRVGRSTQGIDTRCEPEDPSVGDEEPLRPGRDAMGPELFRREQAVLLGSQVGECGADVHTRQWVLADRERNHPFV